MEQVELTPVVHSGGLMTLAYLQSVVEYRQRLAGVVMSDAEFVALEDGVRD